MTNAVGNAAARQPNEVLSGLYIAGATITPTCNGVWHVPAFVTATTGVTLTTISPTPATVLATLAVPGTNAGTTVSSVIVHFAIPIVSGYTYILGGTGLTLPSGGGVVLPA